MAAAGHARAETGGLLSRSSADASLVSATVRAAIPQFVVNAVTAVIVFAGALWASPPLTASTLVASLVLIPPLVWYQRRAPGAFAAVQARLADLTASVAESADGARTVDAFGWARRRTDLTHTDLTASS